MWESCLHIINGGMEFQCSAHAEITVFYAVTHTALEASQAAAGHPGGPRVSEVEEIFIAVTDKRHN